MPESSNYLKNEALDQVRQCTVEKAYKDCPEGASFDMTSVCYRLANKIITPQVASVEIFKRMLQDDLRYYERYFQDKNRSVSRADYVIQLRGVIAGERDPDNIILLYRSSYDTPEQLKACLYDIVNQIPTTIGDWWAGDVPLLRAVMLRCFSKTSEIHEYVANVRVATLEKDLKTVTQKYDVLRGTTPTLSEDYRTLTKQLATISKQLTTMEQQIKDKDAIITELNRKISGLEKSNQRLQTQLTRLLPTQKPLARTSRKQTRFLAGSAAVCSTVLPPTQA